MRKSVKLVGKGLDMFQSRIQFIENENFKKEIVKFTLKNENQSEKAKEKLNDNKNDEEINKNENNNENDH